MRRIISSLAFGGALVLALASVAQINPPAGIGSEPNINGCVPGLCNPYPSAASSPTTCAATIAAVTNVITCLDADTGVIGSPNVTQWTDQTANAYAFGLNTIPGNGTTTPTSPTINATGYSGKKGIVFAAASGEFLATSGHTTYVLNSSATTWCAAAKLTASGNAFGRILAFLSNADFLLSANDFNGANSADPLLIDNNTSNITWFQGNVAGVDSALTLNTETRWCVVFDNTNATMYRNNVQTAQAAKSFTAGTAAGSQAVIAQVIGAGNPGNALLDGTIRRVLVMSRAANTTDRTNIDSFLTN